MTIPKKNERFFTNAQIFIGMLLAFLTPSVAGVAAYYQTVSDLRQDIQKVRLESEQDFVRKEELREVSVKLDKISEDLNKVLGYLEKERYKR
jgi:hypothetical protein